MLYEKGWFFQILYHKGQQDTNFKTLFEFLADMDLDSAESVWLLKYCIHCFFFFQ